MALKWVKIGNLKGPMGPAGDAAALGRFDAIEAKLPFLGRMPNGTDVNNLKVPGVYIISSLANAQTMVNIASVFPSIFIVYGDPVSSPVLAAQTQMVYGATPKKYERISRSSTAWNDWTEATDAAAVAGANPLKGRMPNGTNVNDLKVPGVYIISSLSNAQTMVNVAAAYPSIFIVQGDPAGSPLIFKQTQYVHGTGATYERMSSEQGGFTTWRDMGGDFGTATENYDLDTLGEGRIALTNPTHLTVLNRPSGAGPGMVLGFKSRTFSIFRAQMYLEYAGAGGQGGKVWVRTSDSFTTLSAWKDLTAVAGAPVSGGTVAENAFANEQRKQWFIRRRGGFIGTGGKAAVAIRIDHGAANMRDLVLPDLTRLSLPWGMAINPAPARIGLPESAGVTWADYNDWARSKGMEPWNHGHGHIQALTTAELQQQIIGGRDLLQENMPASAIEGWMVPGVGTNGYGGQSSTNEVGSFFDYEAGRLIMASHAVSSGYGGGGVRPQVGRLVDGQSHVGLDSVTSASVIISLIQQAQDTGGAIQLFLHPSQINLEGMTTPAVLKEVWEFLAAERDAGRLVILSPSGLLLADPTTTRRHNLSRFADFKTRNGRTWTTAWTNTTGWSLGADGVSTTTGTTLSQNVPEALIKHCRGALYEIVAEVSSTSGATARIGSTTVSALKDVAIAAGQTREIRQYVTLPLGSSAEFNMTVGRVSGGDLTIKSVALQPV